MIKNQARENFKNDKAKWYFIQTQCTDLLKAGFAPTVIAYTYKLQPGRVNRLVRSLRQDPTFAAKIPGLSNTGREYNYITQFALRTTQDKADASLFALIYSSLTAGDIYQEINIWAVVDAYRTFLNEIYPRTAKQTVLNTINRAWSLADSFILETGELDICPCCGQKYYVKLSGKQISLRCPMCTAQKNQKAAAAEPVTEAGTDFNVTEMPLSLPENRTKEDESIRQEPCRAEQEIMESEGSGISFLEELSLAGWGMNQADEPENAAAGDEENASQEPAEKEEQPESEDRGLSFFEEMLAS